MAGQRGGGGGFDALAVDQAGAGLARAAFGLADYAAEDAGELVEPGALLVHRLPHKPLSR